MSQIRARSRQLHTLASELAPIGDVPHVLAILRHCCLTHLAGTPGYIVLVDWRARTFEHVEAFGAPTLFAPVETGAPLESADLWAQVVTTGEPRFTPLQTGYAAALPLPGRNGAYGLLALEFTDLPDADEQSFLLALTGLVGQSLDRSVAQTRLAQAQLRLEALHNEAQALNAELRGYTLALTRNVGEPIRRVRDFLKLVERRMEPGLDARTRELFVFARLEADQLANRVGELRSLAMIDGRTLKFEQVNLNGLLIQVQHDLTPLTLGRRVQWQIGALPTVEADSLLLWQVLVELLGFLLDDTVDRPTPVIRIEGEKLDGHLLLRFWDQGKGFAPELAERMFEVLDRSVPRPSGLAQLGMSNVRRIVNRHGGRVWAEGRPGEGTQFFVSLPEKNAGVSAGAAEPKADLP